MVDFWYSFEGVMFVTSSAISGMALLGAITADELSVRLSLACGAGYMTLNAWALWP